jgi:hypothetical protein
MPQVFFTADSNKEATRSVKKISKIYREDKDYPNQILPTVFIIFKPV